MSDTRFRQLLTVYLLLELVAVAAGLLPDAYSSQLADSLAAEPEPWLIKHPWVLAVAMIPLALAALAGVVGLFLLRPWGRTLSMYTTVLLLPVQASLGPSVTSGLEEALMDAATVAWGAVLTAAYLSPVGIRFSANNSFKPKPLRGLA